MHSKVLTRQGYRMGCQKEDEKGEEEEGRGRRRRGREKGRMGRRGKRKYSKIAGRRKRVTSAPQRTSAFFGLLTRSVRHFDKFKLSKLNQDTENGNYLNISTMPCEQLKFSQSSTWFPASHQKLQSPGLSIC